MNRKILCFVLILISLIFISCPSNIPTWMVENGQEIKNYPSWATSCNAFSEWMDWQSEDGKRLHHLVDNTIISDEYTGKFRIGLRGQEIIIGFNNQEGNCIKLYNWYGAVTSWNDSVVFVEQEDPDNKFLGFYRIKDSSECDGKIDIDKLIDTIINENLTIEEGGQV